MHSNFIYTTEDLPFELSSVLNAYSIIAVTNTTGKIIYSNDNFCKISEYTREELLGNDHRIINSSYHEKSFFEELWQTILSGEIWHGEIRNLSKSGSHYWTDTHIIPQKNKNGIITHFVSVRVDISEKKDMEKENSKKHSQLLMADKLSSLGILTTGVAHEINNPNHLIMSNCDLLMKAWEDIEKALDKHYQQDKQFNILGLPYIEVKEEISNMYTRILGGTERINNIVANLKGFAKKNDGKFDSDIQINDVVHSALPLVKNLIDKSTENFKLSIAENIPTFKGNFQEIEQVLINFITNSCQALENEKEGIEIATLYNKASKTIYLEVRDEGIGIQEEIIKKVMDPFFTTKRTSGGTGLGLYVSFEIAERHHAQLSFSKNNPKGCCAQLAIPVNTELQK